MTSKTDIFVRDIIRLGPTIPNEVLKRGSLTDKSQAFETTDLIKMVLAGKPVNARYIPEYDVTPGMTDAEAFATADITKSEGFDLSDTTEFINVEERKKAFQKMQSAKKQKTKKGVSTPNEPVKTGSEPEGTKNP